MSIRNKINLQKKQNRNQREEEYQVEKILESRINPKSKKKEYLVKWKDYERSEATWEPVEHLDKIKDIIQQFERKQQQRKDIEKKQLTNKKQTSSQDDSDVQIVEQNKKNQKQQPQLQDKGNNKNNRYQASDGEVNDYSQDEKDLNNNKNNNNNKQHSKKSNQVFEEEEIEEECVFEEFIDKKVKNGVTQYLVKFQDTDEPQWMNENELSTLKEEMDAYNQKLKEKNNKESNNQQPQRQKSQNVFKEDNNNNNNQQIQRQKSQNIANEDNNNNNNNNNNYSNVINNQNSLLQQSKSKRMSEDLKEIFQGDLKTDNFERIELEGGGKLNPQSLNSQRFEVFWKPRFDGIIPKSTFYSFSYLKALYPNLLVEYFLQKY